MMLDNLAVPVPGALYDPHSVNTLVPSLQVLGPVESVHLARLKRSTGQLRTKVVERPLTGLTSGCCHFADIGAAIGFAADHEPTDPADGLGEGTVLLFTPLRLFEDGALAITTLVG